MTRKEARAVISILLTADGRICGKDLLWLFVDLFPEHTNVAVEMYGEEHPGLTLDIPQRRNYDTR